ncbi:acetylcholine receptor subunit alpha-type acr-16-like [Ostrea edulis]|uniref:acetylcholine receptor subunit alpha-type acr-16-like n=1 Tax=Ostrea edulis TaxID=37623 RepID=UPI0024AF5FD4|nr:acetylcholine receptor subunit alpha-type acr-16-like [Ostrea edulis]
MNSLVVFLLCCVPVALCYSIAQETQLHTDLFTGYQKAIRPGADRTKALSITVDFLLISLKEFSEEDSKLAVIGAFKFSWEDNRLIWDKTLYGGDLQDTSVLQETLWVPNIINLNCFDNMRPLGSNSMSVRVYDSGFVSWLPPVLVESTCDADVTYYPFDSQTCVIRYYIPGYYPPDLNLSPGSSEVDLMQYEQNNLWDITSTSLSTMVNSYGFQELHIQLQMKRRSSYYIAGLILPICLMSFLQVMVYILPEESGERIGFSVTVLLAVAVFLTIIQENLPEASEPSVSLLAYKLLGDVLTGALITTSAIFGSAVYHKDDSEPVPTIVKRLFCTRRKSCCKKSPKVTTINVTEKSPPEDAVNDSDDDVISWSDVGKCYDKCCLFFFTLCLAMNNIVLMIIISIR